MNAEPIRFFDSDPDSDPDSDSDSYRPSDADSGLGAGYRKRNASTARSSFSSEFSE